MNQNLDRPILYSFRRCPFAIRARMVLAYAKITVELREVILRDKSTAMITASPKATVPVLIITDNQILEQSLDIMLWALGQRDPDQWWPDDTGIQQQIFAMITQADNEFKQHLDRYKYASRFDITQQQQQRDQAAEIISAWQQRLQNCKFLFGETISLGDIALFPLIRQFAHVDLDWFHQSFPIMSTWLEYFKQSNLFLKVMKKYPQWQADQQPLYENFTTA